MKVRELRKLLTMYDEELEVIFSEFSDYTILNKDDISLVEAVFKEGYVERYYSHQYTDEDRPDLQTYLAFPGN